MEKAALHPKRMGEAVEVYFMYRATCLGLTLSKPLGDSAPYDIISEHAGRLARVQIKSSNVLDQGRYCVKASYGGRLRAYTPGQIDFLAAYVGPEDAWYIIPIRALRRRIAIHLYPHATGVGQFERYREAWPLLLRPGCHAERAARSDRSREEISY